MLKLTRLLCGTLVLSCGAAFARNAGPHGPAPRPIVQPRFTKPLADLQGKEALVLTVEYPPGAVEAVHRHDAHAFVYMLEGEVVMGLAGGREVTLRPGDTFYEGPDDIHTVGRNASTTRPARFVVVLLKNVGVDPVLPVK
jgi:quercetin dioxygenase-like cupin family protein